MNDIILSISMIIIIGFACLIGLFVAVYFAMREPVAKRTLLPVIVLAGVVTWLYLEVMK